MKEALRSFLIGMASIFDFSGSLNSHYKDALNVDWRKRDYDAIASDWQAVGDDLRKVLLDKIDSDISPKLIKKNYSAIERSSRLV